MFKLINCTGNTYYLACYANVGVYYLGNDEVMLIDSGDHHKSVGDLDAILTERGWRVKMIVNTHSHGDHIYGNSFFYNKYGCDIYASDIECGMIQQTMVDRKFFYNGIPINTPKNPLYEILDTQVKVLTKDVLPEGFDIISLPGHCHNMIGIKTADDVWFLGDAILAPQTYDDYKIPFNLDINASIETTEMLSHFEGKWFVPSHIEPCADIREIAKYNMDKLIELKSYIYSICNQKSFEEILTQADKDMGLCFTLDKYAKISITVKGFLQALIEDKKITAVIENGRMIYVKL